MHTFSHMDSHGNVTMVDVGNKTPSQRIALVEGYVDINAHTLQLLKKAALPKGDVLTTAKIAGILGAKRTADLIPMCHPLSLSYLDVRFTIQDNPPCIRIEAEARTNGPTGVEMEALIAAQIAAATIYDMCKAVQKDMVIHGIRLLRKSGGKSGEYQASDIRDI